MKDFILSIEYTLVSNIFHVQSLSPSEEKKYIIYHEQYLKGNKNC
jgi:hypothetical protein